MPNRPGKPCAHPGCAAIVRDGWLCPNHAEQRQKQYDSARGSAASRGYDARWQKLRTMFLAAHPLCVDPYGLHQSPVAATDVDHKKPKRDGGTNLWDNLQALCHECHSRKTAMENSRWLSK